MKQDLTNTLPGGRRSIDSLLPASTRPPSHPDPECNPRCHIEDDKRPRKRGGAKPCCDCGKKAQGPQCIECELHEKNAAKERPRQSCTKDEHTQQRPRHG